MRKKLKEALSLKHDATAEKCKKTYKDLRDKISVSKEQIPIMLKDIFDLFMDSHSRKGILTTRKLIDENQKRQIRHAVLLCCAFCGPDSEYDSR